MFAELCCTSNFTFLTGASHPEEFVIRAHQLGYQGISITDEASVAGAVRAHIAASQCNISMINGTYFLTDNGLSITLLATCRQGWGELCQLISVSRRRAPKGKYQINQRDLINCTDHLLCLWHPDLFVMKWINHIEQLQNLFQKRLWKKFLSRKRC